MAGGTKERLAHLDGLRGVAILMVVVYHARVHLLGPVGWPAPLDALTLQGYQGVSLFLVLSGFCLAYPCLERRAAGQPQWFVPSQFFARRCIRILPPYYVAFAYFWVMSLGLASVGATLPVLQAPPSAGNVLAHVLLVHNLFGQYVITGNGSFWSLGLEWQWYLVFPLVLLLGATRPRLVLIVSVVALVAWHVLTNDALLLPMPGRYISAALPARSSEFTLGVIAARITVSRWRPPVYMLLGALIAPYAMTIVLPATVAQLGYGIAFASLVLLATGWSRISIPLSWPPLVWLGLCSYSVYLVHEPIVDAIDIVVGQTLSVPPVVVFMLSAVVGVAFGFAFYRLVEVPSQSGAFRRRCVPVLERVFSPANPLFGVTSPAPTTVDPEPQAIADRGSSGSPEPANRLARRAFLGALTGGVATAAGLGLIFSPHPVTRREGPSRAIRSHGTRPQAGESRLPPVPGS